MPYSSRSGRSFRRKFKRYRRAARAGPRLSAPLDKTLLPTSNVMTVHAVKGRIRTATYDSGASPANDRAVPQVMSINLGMYMNKAFGSWSSYKYGYSVTNDATFTTDMSGTFGSGKNLVWTGTGTDEIDEAGVLWPSTAGNVLCDVGSTPRKYKCSSNCLADPAVLPFYAGVLGKQQNNAATKIFWRLWRLLKFKVTWIPYCGDNVGGHITFAFTPEGNCLRDFCRDGRGIGESLSSCNPSAIGDIKKGLSWSWRPTTENDSLWRTAEMDINNQIDDLSSYGVFFFHIRQDNSVANGDPLGMLKFEAEIEVKDRLE